MKLSDISPDNIKMAILLVRVALIVGILHYWIGTNTELTLFEWFCGAYIIGESVVKLNNLTE